MPEYFSNSLTPGVLYFRCEHFQASLSVPTCADMWLATNRTGEADREPCRNCPVGACHAGEADASTSPLCGKEVCARCHRPAGRLICAMHCVSCKNREYEVLKGRNAKGTAPVKLACLSRRRLRYMAGREACTLVLPRSVDASELIVAALRDSKRHVRFGMAGTTASNVRQLRLW